MSKKPVPTILYLEWERLIALLHPPPDFTFRPEIEAQWLPLWHRHLSGDALAETAVDDAANLCALGWKFAACRDDWKTAQERIERWFAHPRLAEANRVNALALQSYRAAAYLYDGQLTTALSHYHLLLDTAPPRDRRLAHVMVRNHLYRYAETQPPESPAPATLTELAIAVIASFRGRKRLVRTLRPGATTYGELYAALDRTYPEPSP